MKSFAHHYSSDISREQFELIRTDLEGIRKRTKPRKVDLYDIFCALLYTLKNGCVWRDLPSDFPKWETVYYYWLLWTKTPSPAGITPLDKVLKNGFVVNTILKEADLFCPNSVRINFTIYLLTFIRNRDRATLQQLVMNYRPNGTEMDTVIRTIQKNYLGIRNACLYDYSNGPLEGINRKIKELKRSCYGFSNLRHFFIRIKLIHA